MSARAPSNNVIRKCECGGAIVSVDDPERKTLFECSICFEGYNECHCGALIPPGVDACLEHDDGMPRGETGWN